MTSSPAWSWRWQSEDPNKATAVPPTNTRQLRDWSAYRYRWPTNCI